MEFPEITPLRILVGILVTYVVHYVTVNYRRFQYWKSLGIPEVNPWLQNFRILALIKMKGTDLGELNIKQIRELGTIFGNNEVMRNSLIVGDAEALKDILVRDFHHFMDRRDFFKTPFVSKFLTQMQGPEWKQTRSIMSPTFTSGKMKAMFPLMNMSLETLVKVYEKSNGGDIDALSTFANFTMDVIAKVAFAVDTNTHDDPNNPFVVNGKRIFRFPKWKLIPLIFFPRWLMELLQMHFMDDGSFQYMKKLGQHMIDQRRKVGKAESRAYTDFLQLMLEAGKDENENVQGGKKTLTDEEIIANIILILLAGYHTTSATLAYACYCLAQNEDAQEKARAEIREALENSKSGKLDYDTLNSLPYLEAVIHETLRLYPPVTQTERQCSEDYVLKVNTPHLGKREIPLPKGTGILIPIYAIHHMEEYYPEPRKFTPERFLPENKDSLVQCTFLSFVTGPRNCIGMRFALLEAKLALANILSKFHIKMSPKTKVPLEFGPSPVLMTPKEVILRFEKIEQ